MRKGDLIFSCFQVFSTSKAIMLAMEYADGGDLLEYVNQQKRLNEMDSCRMFQQIVSGVELFSALFVS